MHAGCPVVSTDCPSGPSEILEGGRYGSLVPVGEPRALADAIVRTLKAPRESDRLRARAETFNVGATLDRILGASGTESNTPFDPDRPARRPRDARLAD